jgi:hypothetical protein
MRQRQAVTMKKALSYRGADRAGKSRILDELVELTALASRLCQGGTAGCVETEDREAQAWSGADVWAAGDSGIGDVALVKCWAVLRAPRENAWHRCWP